MWVKEKVGAFSYKSGISQGSLIRELGINPVMSFAALRQLYCFQLGNITATMIRNVTDKPNE